MAHHKLGNQEQAKQWNDKATSWIEEHKPTEKFLLRLRNEADKLLGADSPTLPSPTR